MHICLRDQLHAMPMSNRWNKFIYRLWSPIYDTVTSRVFLPGRLLAHELLALQPGENVLLIGVGTGADLPLLPAQVSATALDLSAHMLATAQRTLPTCRARIQLVRADAQTALLAERTFDAAILNLILSVVPDAKTCLRNALAALKPGGRLVVFDKFQPDGRPPGLMKNTVNVFSALLGTDITRSFGQLAQGADCVLDRDVPSLLNGMYRVILIHKRTPVDSSWAAANPPLENTANPASHEQGSSERPNGSHQLRGG